MQKTVFQVLVNSTDAMYLYCSQVTHCQNGMAMVINPPWVLSSQQAPLYQY